MRKTKKADQIAGLGTRNYYEVMPSKYMPPGITYPNMSKMNIKLPSRIGVIGASGSMKTNWLLNFIECIDTFDRITLYAKNIDEPLYKFLIDCLKKSRIPYQVFKTIENVIPVSDYSPNENNLVIIDDFQNSSAKALEPINDLFTMGRKNGITTIYIAQTYFKGIPSIIRANLNYLVILKISTKGDLQRMMTDNCVDIDLADALDLLRRIRAEKQTYFMLFDKETNDPSLKVRKNYQALNLE